MLLLAGQRLTRDVVLAGQDGSLCAPVPLVCKARLPLASIGQLADFGFNRLDLGGRNAEARGLLCGAAESAAHFLEGEMDPSDGALNASDRRRDLLRRLGTKLCCALCVLTLTHVTT